MQKLFSKNVITLVVVFVLVLALGLIVRFVGQRQIIEKKAADSNYIDLQIDNSFDSNSKLFTSKLTLKPVTLSDNITGIDLFIKFPKDMFNFPTIVDKALKDALGPDWMYTLSIVDNKSPDTLRIQAAYLATSDIGYNLNANTILGKLELDLKNYPLSSNSQMVILLPESQIYAKTLDAQGMPRNIFQPLYTEYPLTMIPVATPTTTPIPTPTPLACEPFMSVPGGMSGLIGGTQGGEVTAFSAIKINNKITQAVWRGSDYGYWRTLDVATNKSIVNRSEAWNGPMQFNTSTGTMNGKINIGSDTTGQTVAQNEAYLSNSNKAYQEIWKYDSSNSSYSGYYKFMDVANDIPVWSQINGTTSNFSRFDTSGWRLQQGTTNVAFNTRVEKVVAADGFAYPNSYIQSIWIKVKNENKYEGYNRNLSFRDGSTDGKYLTLDNTVWSGPILNDGFPGSGPQKDQIGIMNLPNGKLTQVYIRGTNPEEAYIRTVDLRSDGIPNFSACPVPTPAVTNTPTPVATNTPTPTLPDTSNADKYIAFTLQGAPGVGDSILVDILFHNTQTNVNYSFANHKAKASNGWYQTEEFVNQNIPDGNYDLQIHPKGYLQRVASNITLNQSTPGYTFTNKTMIFGDMNHDNAISIADVTDIIGYWIQPTVTLPAARPYYDYARNGILNIIDVAAIISNWTSSIVEGEKLP